MIFVTENENTNTVSDEVFDAAFSEALDGGEPAAKADEEDVKVDEPVVKVDEPVATVVEPVAQTADQLELAQVKADLAELKAVKVATPAIKEEPAATAEEVQATAEEATAWADFEKDWPEVAAMMKKKQASTESQLQKALDVVKQLTDQVAPIVVKDAASEDEKFTQTVLTTHKDAGTLLPEVEKWLLTLPRHRQIGANFVLDRGSAQDVVDLFTEFKVATGKVEQQAADTSSPVTETDSQTPTPAAERLRKMESVSTRRTSHVEPPDSSDFDGAFTEAIASGQN